MNYIPLLLLARQLWKFMPYKYCHCSVYIDHWFTLILRGMGEIMEFIFRIPISNF